MATLVSVSQQAWIDLQAAESDSPRVTVLNDRKSSTTPDGNKPIIKLNADEILTM